MNTPVNGNDKLQFQSRFPFLSHYPATNWALHFTVISDSFQKLE